VQVFQVLQESNSGGSGILGATGGGTQPGGTQPGGILGAVCLKVWGQYPKGKLV